MYRVLHFMADIQVGSGMAAVVMNYYRHMDRSRVQFDFLYFQDGPQSYEQEIRSLGGRVFRIPRPSPLSMGAIHDFFRQHRGEFRVLHCHPIWSAAVLGPVAKRYGVRAVVLHSHSEKPGESTASILRNRVLLRLSAGRADVCLACSHAAETALMGIPPAVHILPNAIDTEKFLFRPAERAACRRQLGIAPDAPVIGHVGRMVEVKNHRFLLRAFAACLAEAPAAQLLLVGDGPLEPELRALAAELGIQDSVHFPGARRDTPALYGAMDVFAMPSRYEGLSMALLEAQAAGLPCVVSDTVSRESDVTGRMDFLPADHTGPWAECLLRRCAPADRVQGIGEAFRRRRLDIHTAVRDLTEIYEGI